MISAADLAAVVSLLYMQFACSPGGCPLRALAPQSKDMQVGLIGDSALPKGVDVSVKGCLSLYVSPAIA